MEIVKDIELQKDISVKELATQFLSSGGFTAKKLGQGITIWKEMLARKDCAKFLSFPSCLIATGTRGVIRDLVKNKQVDVIITTAGTLALDIIRTFKPFYAGSFDMDDKELHKKGFHRLGSVLIKEEDYGPFMEDFMQPALSDLYRQKKERSSRELAWAFGEILGKEKNCEESILFWAWKNKIPVFVPGLTDGVFGSQLWLFWQQHKDFALNLLEDEQELSSIIFEAKKTGALVLGGGISKHHTIWWNQFHGGLDYAIYITTAAEHDGSLSGARTREAISWGKINERAKHVTVEGDATVILPILVAASI